jgi:membrane associated rhomboid family serine protease
MRVVDGGPPGAPLELDVCPRCRLVWFDAAEMERFAREVPAEAPASPAQATPAEAIETFARMRAEQVRARTERSIDGGPLSDTPPETWQWIPAFLGLPLELDSPVGRSRPPLATWLTAAVILVGALLAMTDLKPAIAALGFVPSDPWRGAGLTWLSSLVVHGGILHLLGNLYFLVLAGDDVEEVIGPARWLALFLLAGVAGNIAHGLFDPRADTPLVGASGAISGLMAFYALRFPRARLAIMFGMWLRFGFLRIPVWVAVIFWLAVQALGAYVQRSGCSSVSAFAHLGGFAIGTAFWAWTAWRSRT